MHREMDSDRSMQSATVCVSGMGHRGLSCSLLRVQNMWNRNNGTTHEAFSLQFIFTTPGQRQVIMRPYLRKTK